MRRALSVLIVPVLGLLLWAMAGQASAGPKRWRGQKVYVPVFSHIYHGDGPLKLNLAATLSIRNTDPDQALALLAVKYYDSQGRMVREFLKTPLSLKPLAATAFFLKESDNTGGLNSFFLVEWQADQEVNPPILESLMAGTRANQGISFRCLGQVISGTP